MSNTIISAFTR